MGTRMKEAYGEFCSHHNRAVEYYKDILKSERKFQTFVKVTTKNNKKTKLHYTLDMML